MTTQTKRDRDSLKNLGLGATEDEIFGAADEEEEEEEAPEQEPPEEPADDDPAPEPGGVEDQLGEVEPLFARGDWQGVCDLLGPPEEAEDLPPRLGLLYATARKELSPDDAPEANPLAIRSMAAILRLPPDSQTAVIVAKRILRRNPAAWTVRAAPPAHTRVVLIVATVLLGAVVGWLLGPGGIGIDEVLREALR